MTKVFTTAKSGRWSNPLTWKGGIIPEKDSTIIILNKHTLTLDLNVFTCGIMIEKGATLSFDSKKSITLDNCENIMVFGRLIIKPSTSSIIHKIKFHEIDESLYKGSDLDINFEDVGLWIMEGGYFESIGIFKTAWMKMLSHTDKSITLESIPINWKVGDELSICPTENINVQGFYSNFETVKISKIVGNIISFNEPLLNKYKFTEVLNLTRNVLIEGTEQGRSHINIMSSAKVSNIQIRYMGPRKKVGQFSEKVLGRYAFHLHKCLYLMSNTIFEGIVVRDCGSHAYVTHATHNITYKNCISYNTMEDAYWWDLPPDNGTSSENNSNGVLYDSCIAAIIKSDPISKGYRLAGFLLGSGIGNKITNCVVIGNHGNAGAAGFIWPESSNYTFNLWIFENNIAHNNKNNGIFVWQNDPHNHIINGFVGYNNGNNGIEHGAYTNAYKYKNISLVNNKNGILLHANPRPKGIKDEYGFILSFTNVKSTDPLYLTVHTLIGEGITFFKDCEFPKVIVNELPRRVNTIPFSLYDFVNCNLQISNFEIISMEKGSRIRVQDNAAFQINDDNTIKQISNFF